MDRYSIAFYLATILNRPMHGYDAIQAVLKEADDILANHPDYLPRIKQQLAKYCE